LRPKNPSSCERDADRYVQERWFGYAYKFLRPPRRTQNDGVWGTIAAVRFDILTIFPEFFAGPLEYGIVRRARQAGLIETQVCDLRGFTHDRHRTVDDRPFGGGEGMVMKPEPLFEAVESLLGAVPAPPQTAIVLLSAAGKLFRQETARRFAKLDRLVLLCGPSIWPPTKSPSEISYYRAASCRRR
jgi:hypothetical protein